jgi:transcriptional regulator with XRE-family HTH domain
MPRRTLAAFDLKAARKMRGLSQMQTAEILCVTQPSVARWEANGNMPDVFRKVWGLHWQLEAEKTKMSGGLDDLRKLEGTKRKLKEKTSVKEVSKQSDEQETSERVEKVSPINQPLRRGRRRRVIQGWGRSGGRTDIGSRAEAGEVEVESTADVDAEVSE